MNARGTYRVWAEAVLVACLATVACWTQFRLAVPRVELADRASQELARFEELKDSLPTHGVVGYLTDMDLQEQTGSGLWYLAEYSVAPVVLKLGTDSEWVVGNFTNPSAAADLIARSGLEVVRRYDSHLLLLRRKAR